MRTGGPGWLVGRFLVVCLLGGLVGRLLGVLLVRRLLVGGLRLGRLPVGCLLLRSFRLRGLLLRRLLCRSFVGCLLGLGLGLAVVLGGPFLFCRRGGLRVRGVGRGRRRGREQRGGRERQEPCRAVLPDHRRAFPSSRIA